ncbi:adenylate/guanylate cyclase domain-containing protein [Bradyrhizobium sp. AUGA SZCCT0240]|uniref:adenylate/guanylate cyclase domain-containing protein n=1 Tax=unclassified Bradyrhizobium TaxID=2631580 RepID=UPI001BA71678|nr:MULTISPECIES: adenylate/guanylate cyclase domain-containing protein [unclassified Bradyrhizobium]MBR1200127.1 adenylate/guanylate cyclase domain-containing protein [Bradyrhizobium sp. AUGA SZCCT0158]MBR1240465.1 adenylate/guanylate cyclase domain-containing protein [Bradyrhizobium sp. AUGA SZCCT0274]MBR1258177.1 adenylate/guanylate cyclase domain-containing protein [Bradyrhizobium sp. AUGA SZCCT0240]
MDVPGPERRLAAVLAADMVGYSRLMEVDETGTLARLKTHRIELIDPAIAKNHGRIIKTTGDGMLVEFRSVADAVLCAAEIQRRMARRNADVSPARWIQFRIGINLGDVIVEDNDIFGDGVNVAARLEMLAEPGGICVSGAVRDQVGQRLDDVAFEDLGEQSVKNIVRPIRVFRVRLDADPEAAPEGAKDAAVAAPASKKPSIAVLPLANMSGDPEQEFFADGLTEDIITELSRFRDLLVISRNSTFVHKGKAVNVREIAREFGVDYVLEGSVRKARDRVRVTVQLIDAETDQHVWAERYDRELEDIFAIQDEITHAIVATLPGRVEAARHDRAKRKPTESMAAYECVLAAKVRHHRSTREDNAEAQRLLDRALALDPNYAHAHAWKACVLGQTWVYGWCADRDATFDQVAAELEVTLALDDNDSDVHRILAALNLNRNDHDKAAYHQERGLALNPNYDLVVVQQGELLTWLGRPEEGIDWIKKAMRLNPYHPERFWSHLGRACYCAEKYADAIEAFSRITRPDYTHHAFLAATFAQMGNAVAAAAHAAEVLKSEPTFSVAVYLATQHYKHAIDRQRHEAGLLKAGLPA